MRQQVVDIDDRKDDLMELFEDDPATARSFWSRLDLSWVYHELALEGVVVTAEEMQNALSPDAPPVAEVSKLNFLNTIRRQRDAIELAKEEAKAARGKISLPLLKKFYDVFTSGLPEDRREREKREREKEKDAAAGIEKPAIEFRRDMPLHRTYFHDIAQPPKIVPELTKLFDWTQTAEFNNLHPLQQASVFHHRFMAVFPFTDLSGKIGRLLMNVMIMRAGYLPSVIHAIDRQRYFESLKHQPRTLQTLVTEAIEHATDHGFKVFAHASRGQSRAGNS